MTRTCKIIGMVHQEAKRGMFMRSDGISEKPGQLNS